jgi:hypothetical protein
LKAITVSLLICASAQAQVFHCPALYPQATHAVVGDAHTFATPSRLNRGGVYLGDIGSDGELHGDRRSSKKGAIDVTYGLPDTTKKWFVCEYGESSITMWTAINDKATACTLQQRRCGDEVTVKAECK